MKLHRPALSLAGACFLVAGVASGCDLFTGGGPVPTTVVLSRSTINLDAIGVTETLTAEVRDENDRVLPNAPVIWESSNPSVATVSESGLVTALANGVATITAMSRRASGSASVSVAQVATSLELVSGDAQEGPAGESLPEPLVVRAFDRLGNPASGVPVEFKIVEGGGSVAPPLVQTDPQGRAAATWTLGSGAGEQQSVRGFLSFRVGEGVNFTATAVPGLSSRLVVVSGDGQSGPRGTPLPEPIVVRAEDRFENPVPGTTMRFVVVEGQGSVQPSAVSTDAAGVATTQWTLGAPLGEQALAVTVGSLAPTTVTAIATEVPQQLQVLSADEQVGTVGERVEDPPSVRVLGPGGGPIRQLDVRFSASGNGLVESAEGSQLAPSVIVRTAEDGVATLGGWILGTIPGMYEVTIEVPGLSAVTLSATAQIGAPSNLAKVSGDGQLGVVGTVLDDPLVVLVTDLQGNPVPGVTVTFMPGLASGSLDPAQGTTLADGTASTAWTLGSSPGSQFVTASVDAGPSVEFSATAAGGNGVGGLSIDLHFVDQPTTAQRQAFDQAVNRWAELIPGKLDPTPVQLAPGACGGNPSVDTVVDDVLVFVRLQPIDGIAGTLGQAGLCRVRASVGLPLVARLTLDTDDVGRLELGGRLVDLILHELGHALGFGTLWTTKGLLQNPSLPSSRGSDTHFSGPAAIAAFDLIGGAGYNGQKVPVENVEGGFGTRDSHWRASVFANELMTGFLTTGANPLSRVTIASLGDLGYVVDEDGADSFQVVPTPPPAAVGEEPLPLGDDILRGPVYIVDESGRIVGLMPD